MARPLKGSKTPHADGRVTASLPATRGSRKRIGATFDSELQADRWLTAGIAALLADGHPPDPSTFKPVAAASRARIVPEAHRTVQVAARLWAEEYYEKQRHGQPSRKVEAKSYIRSHIEPFMHQAGVTLMVDLQHDDVVDFASFLAGQHLLSASERGEHVNDEVLLTRRQLLERAAKSRSSVGRALGKTVKPVDTDERGTPLYRLGDARAAGLLQNEQPQGGLQKYYATDILWTLKQIVLWAYDHDWIEKPVGQRVHGVGPDAAVARNPSHKKQDRAAIPLEACAKAAADLVFIDQVAMWIQRLLGLRLGEAFGPFVGDLVDSGAHGILVVDKQGGRTFLMRDGYGNIVRRHHKDQLKNDASVRVLIVAEPLMVLLRVLIEAYHTDPDTGEVDLEARLIPGRRYRNRAGAQSYANHLTAAFIAVGEQDEFGADISTHSLRAALATDLHWSPDQLVELARKRFFGHAIGDDVHDRVYVLDHPDLAPQLAVAVQIGQAVDAELGSLLITPRVHKWDKGNAFYDRRGYIDLVLARHGMLGSSPGPALADTAEVAQELGIAVTTARRLLRSGAIPGTELVSHDGPKRYVAPRGAVESYRDRPHVYGTSLPDAAGDLGLTYHEAYRLLCDLEIEVERDSAGAFHLDDLTMARMRRELTRVRDLHARAVRHTEAAKRLRCSRRSVSDKLSRGELALDDETDSSGAQFVTLDSINAYLTVRSGPRGETTDRVDLPTAAEATGLTERVLMDLARAGHLDRVPGRTTVTFTRCSLVKWCSTHRPDLVGAVRGDRACNDEGCCLEQIATDPQA